MKPFSQTFSELRGGEADFDASKAVAEVIAEVRRLAKPGKVTITLDIEPIDKAGSTPRIFITESITTKIPTAPVDPTMFFTDDENCPTRHDPQQKLFERSMSKITPMADMARTPLPGSLGSGPIKPTAASDGGPAQAG